MATPSAKPVVKDVVVNLLNPPRGLLLGTKQYKLDFMVMNLRDEVKNLHIAFKTESFSLDQDAFDVNLSPKEKKNLNLNISPMKDGSLELSMTVSEKKTIKYTEKVLEGTEETPVVAAQATTTVKPAPTTPTIKPSKTAVKSPVKPVKPVIKPGTTPVTPPVKAPAKPITKTPAKPVKPAMKPSSGPSLKDRIGRVKQKYMELRGKLQELSVQLGEGAKGSSEYQSIYQEATKLKEEYERLGKLQQSQGQDVPSGGAPTGDVGGVGELKKMMDEYNILKAKLVGMDQNSPEYAHIKQKALAIYKEYNDKRAKMVGK